MYGSGLISQWIGIYEKNIIKKIIKYLKPNKIYYDIGAHIGYYSFIFSKFGRKVYSFEPHPLNFYFLKEHIKLNNLKNTYAFNFAIYSENKKVFFELNDDRTEGKIKNYGNFLVDAFTLDYLIYEKKFDEPDFIKIDVEGAELEVLKGSQKILKFKKPLILISIHSENLKNEILFLLKKIGYKEKIISKDVLFFHHENSIIP
ncbi:MAG: FkbM family methyltransferase [candidate division WOR-3 bacterium]